EAEPDAVIGGGVEICGDFEFDKLLPPASAHTSHFQGTGDLIVGPAGCIFGDLILARRMRCEGRIFGKIVCDELLLLGSADIRGDITARILEVRGQARVAGRMNVHSGAPGMVDAEGNI
ncbi:hypothetical protein B484DRAFT_313016, partial [Ochromonadaceae sp. CCMP2298]